MPPIRNRTARVNVVEVAEKTRKLHPLRNNEYAPIAEKLRATTPNTTAKTRTTGCDSLDDVFIRPNYQIDPRNGGVTAVLRGSAVHANAERALRGISVSSTAHSLFGKELRLRIGGVTSYTLRSGV
jgi:hypothetical protein